MPTNADTPDASPSGNSLPKPWDQPRQEVPEEDGTAHGTDGGVTGDLAAGAIDGAAEVAGAAIEGVGTALEVLGGCGEGCGSCSCSLVILVTLFTAAGSAMALFR